MISSPLNYTGNKSRLLSQLLPMFPKKINRFLDVCCGGGTVGLNVSAKHIIAIDSNAPVIDLLNSLKTLEEKKTLLKIDQIISKFGLSDSFHKSYGFYKDFVIGNNGLKYYNLNPYKQLREFYNTHSFDSIQEKSIYLFVLLAFCFNNDIRFNSQGFFNMPVGKTDFNGNIRKKFSSFKAGIAQKNIDFYMADFRIIREFRLTSKDFVYVDPPYLITDAVYNENGGWTEKDEEDLLEVLSELHAKGVPFALSNVLCKKGRKNYLLQKWIKKHHFDIVDLIYHYRSSSYNKKDRDAKEREILVCNYAI